MNKSLLLNLVALLLTSFAAVLAARAANPADSPLGGQWRGSLKVPGGAQDMVITIVPLSNGSLYATLDVPKQHITRMPVQAEVKGSDITMRIEEAASKFVGKLSADKKKMTGTWTQPGVSAPLALEHAAAPVASIATGTKVTMPYREEEVVIPNKIAKLRLTGTLTMPHGSGPFPAVVLVSDSGPQDRNCVVGNYRMFHILADHFTRNGFAVLRYDDRGVGKSTGDYPNATTADLASDAQAAMGFLRAHYKVDKEHVGMVGHGEGANVALLAAAQPKAPNFVVSLAGYGLPGPEVLKRQQVEIMRLIGANSVQVDAALKLHQQMLDIIRQTPKQDLARAQVAAMLRMSNADIDFTMVQARTRQLTSPWYRFFIDFDPKNKLGDVKCPVLALNGATDLLVSAQKNLAPLQKGLRAGGNRKVETHKLTGVNHLFQSESSHWPLVNGQLQPTFSPKALETIDGWLAKYAGAAKPVAAATPAVADKSAAGSGQAGAKRAMR